MKSLHPSGAWRSEMDSVPRVIARSTTLWWAALISQNAARERGPFAKSPRRHASASRRARTPSGTRRGEPCRIDAGLGGAGVFAERDQHGDGALDDAAR